MCKWMNKVVDGVEVYQVGKQQLWDWCSYNGREFTGWLPEHQTVYSYVDSLRKGIYLVVEIHARFGRVGRVQLVQSYTSLKSAVHYARLFGDETLGRVLDGRSGFAHVYEVWHVVDDGELWHEWECLSAQYVFEHQLGCNVPDEYVTDEAYAAMGRVAPWNDLDYAPASLEVGHAGSDVLEALRQLREAGEQYEYSSGVLSGSLARAEAFVDA